MELPNGGFVANDQTPAPAPAEQSTAAAATPGSETPVKRRPGRPKGSTKKHLAGEAPVARVKRPVGRPRKDGFPAGSVGPPRPPRARPRPPAATPWPYQLAIDPNLQPGPVPADDWALLARTGHSALLVALLAALAAPNPVAAAGPSVEDAFKSHLNSLAPVASTHQPIPALYSILKTFWLPASPAYFSLTASASTARTPSEHRFLYWDPQPLVFNGIACPSCASPLANHGRISSGPVKIYDIERPFFVIGCEYVCRSPSCLAALPDGRKFASTDASIFRALPAKLKDEFPARLLCADADAGSGPNVWNWSALGVSLSLWNLVRACLRSGMRKEAILQLIDAVQRGVPEDCAPPAPAPGAAPKHLPEAPAEPKRESAPAGEGEMNHVSFCVFDAWKSLNGADVCADVHRCVQRRVESQQRRGAACASASACVCVERVRGATARRGGHQRQREQRDAAAAAGATKKPGQHTHDAGVRLHKVVHELPIRRVPVLPADRAPANIHLHLRVRVHLGAVPVRAPLGPRSHSLYRVCVCVRGRHYLADTRRRLRVAETPVPVRAGRRRRRGCGCQCECGSGWDERRDGLEQAQSAALL
ncbi:hypothetical protein C0992_009001 [Termitomyces sp. T32_za158]|nr:hypothetical protein C0992_009001 [Termitomyces sp. T32_za158]